MNKWIIKKKAEDNISKVFNDINQFLNQNLSYEYCITHKNDIIDIVKDLVKKFLYTNNKNYNLSYEDMKTIVNNINSVIFDKVYKKIKINFEE